MNTQPTKYPPGSLREFATLALPLILVLLSGGLMELCDRLFLAHSSFTYLHGSLLSLYLIRVFQVPCTRVALMAQVFVGHQCGAGSYNKVGPYIWQMIWFSLLSTIIVVPFGLLASPIFFKGSSIEEVGSFYFCTLLGFNFLFPLSASLSAFYIGRGRPKMVVISTVAAHMVNITLDALLILGIEGWIPPLGITGSLLAKIAAQLVMCTILFCYFIRNKNRTTYGTNQWMLRPHLLWECLRIGVPRSFTSLILLAAWAATSHVMMNKTEEHLLVISIGGSLILSFYFIPEGMSQAVTTIASYLIGAKKYVLFWKSLLSSFIGLLICAFILAIPLICFPGHVLNFFGANIQKNVMLHTVVRWTWLFFVFQGASCLILGILFALQDTLFLMWSACFMWITSFLPIYLGIEKWNWSPDKLWLTMACEGLLLGTIYLIRMNYILKGARLPKPLATHPSSDLGN